MNSGFLTQPSEFTAKSQFLTQVMLSFGPLADTSRLIKIGVRPVFRQPRIHTGQYLDKYCFNQSESGKNINNPK